MHGCSPESVLLVNAEVDSMGGVIDSGVDIDNKTSPRQAAIEKAQAELRLEYDVREERRRELEFLEKGGNPLDFKPGPATSISIQSTSVTDQLVTSEAKDSFPCTASPHGDSVESSGRPGAHSGRETNSADNLLLYDGENDAIEGGRNTIRRNRSNITPSEQFSQIDGSSNVKESDDSAMFRLVVKSQAYARRNRSRSGRDSARVSSTELASAGDGNGSLKLPSSRHSFRDGKGSLCEANTQKDRTASSVCNSKSTSPNGNVVIKNLISDSKSDRDLNGLQADESTYGLTKVGEGGLDVASSKDLVDGKHSLHVQDIDGQVSNVAISEAADLEKGRQDGVLPGTDSMPGAGLAKIETLSNLVQNNGYGNSQKDGKSFNRKDGIDSESSCIHTNHVLDRNTSNDQYLSVRKINSQGNIKTHASKIDEAPNGAVVDMVKGKNEAKDVGILTTSNENQASGCLNPVNGGPSVKIEEEICDNKSAEHEMNFLIHKETEHTELVVSQTAGKLDNLSGDSSNLRKAGSCQEASELQTCTESELKFANKVHEDSILEEARSIEAKRKRIAQLSVGSFPLEFRQKSHWDFVLEEMAWLANDFSQERLWKTAAAIQLSRCAALNARSRFDKQNLFQKQKKIAYTLAKAIMEFWRTAKVLLNGDDPSTGLNSDKLTLVGAHLVDESDDIKEKSKYSEKQNAGKHAPRAIHGYAVRFLKYSGSLDCSIEAEAPVTPERISDSGVVDMSWEDTFSFETLFYTVPPGALENYRKSMEFNWSQCERTGGNMDQEEVDTSTFDNATEFGSRDYSYEEDEREMGSYYLPGAVEGSKSSKFTQKKRKGLQNPYARSCELGADFAYGQGHYNENKVGTQSSSLMGKRPSNSLNVGSIPTKRIRTAASRQRVLSPFNAGAVGGVPMTSKTDASSGDTSSFQDDQSTIHGGSQIRKSLEVESTGEFGKQVPFDCTEVSTKPKKKKKPKHIVYKSSLNSTDTGGFILGKGSVYEQRWQLDSIVQNDQKDFSKKRLESQALESNGPFGQHAAKRPKITKQLHDTSPENIIPATGTIPSPVASQMSNMSNPNKFMKMIAGRDRGRKKGLKMPAGQSGSGSQWSLFEDQALVVLVHDMGPNWELVSDAINSTLQFKCIFRMPKECKERHKFLMDKNAGDGADSAEDSGSSQPYPSTLPGIPKGSARQLFQRLQGPMEEDTLKSHFGKIILIGQTLHSRRNKNDNQDQKQITPVHNSHLVALSHVCPNNLNGVILTPRDLCEATASNSDILSMGCQNSHNSGLTLANHGSLAPALPTSAANSLLQGSSSMVLSNNLPSPSSALNALTRDGQRYNVQRPASLPVDEHQKMQRYNQIISGRTIQHSGLATPGSLPNDRGVRILPGGSGMGMMSGMNRGMLPRPGYQGMGSPAVMNMVSSGSMLASTGVGMPTSSNMHNGTVSGQGNPMMRTREALHLMRNPEDQRQLMMQELQMQATQGNNQGIPAFNGLSTGFSNQTVTPPVQSFPVQQQQQMAPQQSHVLNNTHAHLHGSNHAATSPQQVIMLRLAKERHLQQRMLHHQHQQQQQHHHHQFAGSSPSMHHSQPQSQHPIPSSLPNASQIQQQAPSQPVSMPPSTSQHPLTSSSPMIPTASQSQQKHHLPSNGLGRNIQAGGSNLPTQMLKQRQRQQQLQQPSRQHPQQRPQPQSLQQAKVMKGMGRGNMMIHQNLPIDPSSVNGISQTLGNQVAEKNEQSPHMMPAQGVFPGSGSTAVHAGKQSVHPQPSNHCSTQQKIIPCSPSPSPKQLPQISSHQENSNQCPVSPSSSGQTLLTPHQPSLPLAVASQQQQQAPQRKVGQSQQTGLRVLQQNCQVNSDTTMQSSVDHVQVSHQPLTSGFQMATSVAPSHCCGESTGVIPAASSTNVHPHWKSLDPLYDSGAANSTTSLASIRNPALPSPAAGETLPLPGQGLNQRQLSSSIPMHGHNVGTQWQQPAQQQKLQVAPSRQSPPPAVLQQQSPPSQQLPPPQQQSQQNLQSGQGGPYARPTKSGSG